MIKLLTVHLTLMVVLAEAEIDFTSVWTSPESWPEIEELTSHSPKSQYIKFLSESSKLKQTPRTGWVQREIPHPESVADHSHRMALMALTFPNRPPGVDVGLAVQMCVIHDLVVG